MGQSIGDLISRAGERLSQEKAYIPLHGSGTLQEIPRALQDGFLGISNTFGSILVVHICDGSDMREQELRNIAEGMQELVASLRDQTGVLHVGAARTKMATSGLSCVLVSGGIPSWMHSAVPGLKSGSFWKKQYSAVWALDIDTGQILKHRGAPLVMPPGANYLKSLVTG